MDKERKEVEIPDLSVVAKERKRLHGRSRFSGILNSTIAILLVVAAAAVLISTLWMPVLEIYGSSMNPLLKDGNIVILNKTSNLKQGDVIAFYYNNKILVKRIIATGGDWVNMDENGNVAVNDKVLDEPYVDSPALGQCDITFPYQVPEESYFVMGDHRSVSIDSRSKQIGCVRQEQVVGKIDFRIWPLKKMKWIS